VSACHVHIGMAMSEQHRSL